MNLEALKEQAALKALEEVRSGMRLGLGTGSTVYYFLKHLGEALAAGRLDDVAGVPTSEQTTSLCREMGIPLTSLSEHPELDLAVDGTDEVTPGLDLIKGLGAALLREKMVASAAKRFVVIADATKKVSRLGERVSLPVEVVTFEWKSHLPFLEGRGARPVLRTTCSDEAPLQTDNGNFILDCRFSPAIDDPAALSQALTERAGIVDTGLFLGMCDRAVIALEDGIEVVDRDT